MREWIQRHRGALACVGERISAPPSIDGPVFMSAGVLSGFEFGPGPLDP